MFLAPSVPRKWWWASHTVVVLLFLLAFQILWFVGTTTLKDFERLQKEYLLTGDEIARISVAGIGVGAAPSPSAKSLIEPLAKKQDAIVPQMESAIAAIKAWNLTWRWIVAWNRGAAMEGAANDNGEVRSANGATQVLGLYILPLLYGWLGALLWVVHKLQEDDSDEAVDRMKPGPRVVTGMVAGPMVGMFVSPEFLNSLALQATPFVLAFLGGYSTDVFFALIDRVLRTVKDALDKSPKADATVSPAAAVQQK